MALAQQVHVVDGADGQRHALARRGGVDVGEAVGDAVVDDLDALGVDADVLGDLAKRRLGVRDQPRREVRRRADEPAAHPAALRAVADLGHGRRVEAAEDEERGLLAQPREAERERRVPRGEPADDRVALADLPPQLGRARLEALLEVIHDLVALLERVAVDARERVAAAVDVEDAGHCAP